MLRWWRRRDRQDRELQEEIAAHLGMATQDRIERGEDAASAIANARREFGNEVRIREITREMWGFASWERFLSDTKYALRTLRRHPAFALTAILCLGLGIGATTATFGLADALLLRPLPVYDPDGLVVIASATAENSSEGLSYRDLMELHTRTTSFSGIAGFQLAAHTLAVTPDELPRRKMGMYVAGDFFATLGTQAMLGRTFTSDELRVSGRGPVVLLSYSFWQSEFGGRAGAVGTTVRLNGQPFTVVGVAPEGFTPNNNLNPAYYIPYAMVNSLSPSSAGDRLEDRSARGFAVRARLSTGVTRGQAMAEVRRFGDFLSRNFPETHKGHGLFVRSELEERVLQSPPLAAVSLMLVVLAVAVLAIACANVTSLLLARARARSREIAIRLSVGAGRGRLLQQLITESFVLSLLASVAGVMLAAFAIRYLAAMEIPTDTPIVVATRLDLRVLAAALLAAVLTTVAAGLAPAWRIVSNSVKPASHTRLRNGLVVAQVALSLVLLVVSGVMIDAFRQMLLQDPGIRTDRLMMVELDPSLIRYTPEQTRQFYRTLVSKARELPGARSAAISRAIPFRPNFTDEKVAPEHNDVPGEQAFVTVTSNVVDAGYFDTLGVRLLRGRTFSSADTQTSPRVAIVNEELARRFWPGQDPLHRRFRIGTDGPYVEVVGVAQTGKYLALAEKPQPYFYLPFEQHLRTRMTLMVETSGEGASLARPVLDLIRSIDPNQPVFNVRDMRTYYHAGVIGMSLTAMRVVWVMAGAGLILACIGLYGLISFSVTRRTREIGIRIAIGADRGRVLRLFVRQAIALAAWGIGVGLILSLPAFRALASALAGLGELSAWTLVLAPLCLLIATVAAAWIPARAASRIDPNLALRLE